MLNKLRGIVFAAVIAMLLFAPLGIKALQVIGIPLPSSIGANAVSSQLEWRQFAKFPAISFDSVASGSFQKGFESYLSDRIPFRDEVVLANAAAQRDCIALANLPFAYEAYPTYFESQVLSLPNYHALSHFPSKRAECEKGIDEYASGLHAVASNHPDTRFIVMVVDWSNSSIANPAYELASDVWTTDMTCNAFSNAFSDLENVRVVSAQYEKTDEYYQDFFETDHHWNINGVSKAYELLVEQLGFQKLNLASTKPLENLHFSGSYARTGRIRAAEEVVFDTTQSFENLTLNNSDGSSETGDEHVFFHQKYGGTEWDDFHGSYYGTASSVTSIESEQTGAAVLILDSYGSSIKRPIAENYGKLYCYPDMHSSSKSSDLRLTSRIDMPDVKDVIIVACTEDFVTQAKRMPQYFE